MRRALGLGDWLGLRLGSRAKAPLAGLALLASAFLLLGLSAPVSALTIDPNPVLFDNGSVSGSITLVEAATGIPSGGNVLAGSVSGTDTSLVFEVTLDPGSDPINEIGVAIEPVGFTFTLPTGGGDIAGTGDVGIDDVDDSLFGQLVFVFDGNLGAGQTSDRFFISFGSLSAGQQVNFMISPADGTSDFFAQGTLVDVPEASLGLLAGVLALGGVAAAAIRRQRRDL
jgi:hypothetical protein